jgi:hypothetical protein
VTFIAERIRVARRLVVGACYADMLNESQAEPIAVSEHDKEGFFDA